MIARTISLTVNGRPVTATVEPNTQLADLLREDLLLTGTHLGCEHGICGACTVYIDDAPARSCITYAVACEGAEITTIEGFEDDEIMAQLRAAFSREHGLQCGYCTPGMLATARDIVRRLPDADDRRIRAELSGNLCRCTGYVGIVRAIRRVLDDRRANGASAQPAMAAALGPVGAGHAAVSAAFGGRLPEVAPAEAAVRPAATARPVASAGAASSPKAAPGKPAMEIRQSFTVDHPRRRVWAFFEEIEKVVACMPGASLAEPPNGNHVRGKIGVKLGPITANFAGEADIERDPTNYRGVIRGSGRDARAGSSARGDIHYALTEENGGAATRVDIRVGFTLTGALAQFSRTGIVNDLADRLTRDFAHNLQVRLGGAAEATAREPASVPRPPAELNIGSVVLSVLWARLKALFGAAPRR